jgi:hypothetical protein
MLCWEGIRVRIVIRLRVHVIRRCRLSSFIKWVARSIPLESLFVWHTSVAGFAHVLVAGYPLFKRVSVVVVVSGH